MTTPKNGQSQIKTWIIKALIGAVALTIIGTASVEAIKKLNSSVTEEEVEKMMDRRDSIICERLNNIENNLEYKIGTLHGKMDSVKKDLKADIESTETRLTNRLDRHEDFILTIIEEKTKKGD